MFLDSRLQSATTTNVIYLVLIFGLISKYYDMYSSKVGRPTVKEAHSINDVR